MPVVGEDRPGAGEALGRNPGVLREVLGGGLEAGRGPGEAAIGADLDVADRLVAAPGAAGEQPAGALASAVDAPT